MKKLFTNIKTSIFGTVAGLPMIAAGIAEKDIVKIITGIGTLLIGLYAKDHNN